MKSGAKTDWYRERRTVGLCGLCGKPPTGTRATCDECRSYRDQKNARYRHEVLEAYGARCFDCGETDPAQLLLRRKTAGGPRLSTWWVWSHRFPDDIELWCTTCRRAASEKNRLDYFSKNFDRRRAYDRKRRALEREANAPRVIERRQRKEQRALDLGAARVRARIKREEQIAYRQAHAPEIKAEQQRRDSRYARKAYRTNPEKFRARVQARRAANPEKFRAYNRKSRRTPRGVVDKRMRQLLKRILRATGGTKTDRTWKMLGYSPAEFKLSIEQRFNESMTWGNLGKVWEIDHIREVALFLDEGVTDPAVINALANLQPLLVVDHRAKTASFLSARAG